MLVVYKYNLDTLASEIKANKKQFSNLDKEVNGGFEWLLQSTVMSVNYINVNVIQVSYLINTNDKDKNLEDLTSQIIKYGNFSQVFDGCCKGYLKSIKQYRKIFRKIL